MSSVSANRCTRSRAAVGEMPNVVNSSITEPQPMPELEAPARRVIERDGLTGEHRRMPERVAEHELTLHEPFGLGEQPRVRRERLVHVVLLGHRRGEVVHAGHADEPAGLGGPRLLDHRLHAQVASAGGRGGTPGS